MPRAELIQATAAAMQRHANHQPRHTLALRMVQALAAASLTAIAVAVVTAVGGLLIGAM